MSRPLYVALLVCVIAALGEGAFMGRDGTRFMKALKQPLFAPSMTWWTVIGIGYYVLCFFATYRLTRQAAENRFVLLLLLIVVGANTFWNYIYFRLRDLRLVFWYSVVYALTVVSLEIFLIKADRAVALAFAVYVAYLPYALVLFFKTWKLNS